MVKNYTEWKNSKYGGRVVTHYKGVLNSAEFDKEYGR